MPKFRRSKWQVLAPALLAGFLAIMCAGPGTLIVPAAVLLTGPIVCERGAGIEYRRVRYGYHRLGESALEVNCAERGIQRSKDVFGRAVLALFGIYFVLFFIPLLFLSLTPAVSAAPPGQLPVLGQEAEREVRDLLTRGRKVEAIRRVREITGAGLKQAKDYVDLLSQAAPPVVVNGPGAEPVGRQPEDPIIRLKRLKEMADSGLITEQDYKAKKGEILSGM